MFAKGPSGTMVLNCAAAPRRETGCDSCSAGEPRELKLRQLSWSPFLGGGQAGTEATPFFPYFPSPDRTRLVPFGDHQGRHPHVPCPV